MPPPAGPVILRGMEQERQDFADNDHPPHRLLDLVESAEFGLKLVIMGVAIGGVVILAGWLISTVARSLGH